MTKERAAKIILDMINGAESTYGHSLSTTEIIALKKAYCALNTEPTTNADRIRKMNDDELAELLRDTQCNTCAWQGNDCDYADECKAEKLEMLKQECDDNGT